MSLEEAIGLCREGRQGGCGEVHHVEQGRDKAGRGVGDVCQQGLAWPTRRGGDRALLSTACGVSLEGSK